jgi:pyruvate dehydrogenase E1 component
MLPFFIFYSMFGFQRVGDLVWAFADQRGRGFMLGATAGRTTLPGEGLQHDDGHSQLLASAYPNCLAYDPAFAYELAAIIKDGCKRMLVDGDDVFYYLTVYNENYAMPPKAEGVDAGIIEGLYPFAATPDGTDHPATVLFSGSAHGAAREAQAELAEHFGVGVDLWSATSYKRLREEALAVERWNRLHPTEDPRTPLVTQRLAEGSGPVVAVTDFMRAVPDQVSRWSPRPWSSLGTDGFGRSEARADLRNHFEVDAKFVVLAALSALARDGAVEAKIVQKAIKDLGIDPEKKNPATA